ncbi:hypothetical protein [Deinococcus kurensis]|uniref:hypothetical protein n=1 Tax=Deinococcus kurensis TaxID=2662757 RepID=UPI0012D2B045|nr:hypothetical protein [Deinococcus kurensis]
MDPTLKDLIARRLDTAAKVDTLSTTVNGTLDAAALVAVAAHYGIIALDLNIPGTSSDARINYAVALGHTLVDHALLPLTMNLRPRATMSLLATKGLLDGQFTYDKARMGLTRTNQDGTASVTFRRWNDEIVPSFVPTLNGWQMIITVDGSDVYSIIVPGVRNMDTLGPE